MELGGGGPGDYAPDRTKVSTEGGRMAIDRGFKVSLFTGPSIFQNLVTLSDNSRQLLTHEGAAKGG